jgi:hypothetical protein
MNRLVQKGTIYKFTTSYNIPKYTTSQPHLWFWHECSKSGIVEIFVVNVLSHYCLTIWIYVSFLYYNFSAVCPHSTQGFILISLVIFPIQEAVIILCYISHTRKPAFFIDLQPRKPKNKNTIFYLLEFHGPGIINNTSTS